MVRLLFPTVIHEIPIKNFRKIKDDIIKRVYLERDKDPDGAIKSNVGGWQSQELDDGEELIISTIVNKVGDYFSRERILTGEQGLDFMNFWININNKDSYNMKHIHGNADLSGVFWIKFPPKSGNIQFDSPFAYNRHNEVLNYSSRFKEKCNLYPTYWLEPIEGNVVVFPASLYHRVTQNKTNEDRISIAFNIRFM